MMEQVLDVPTQEVITKDNAMVSVDGVVFYQVLDAAKAAYEVNDLELAILNLTMTNIRTVMGSMDLDELLSQRDKINAQLLHVVDDATHALGHQGHAHRDQGHRAAEGSGRFHGPPDEGRARQARQHPGRRRLPPGRHPEGRRREAVAPSWKPKAAARRRSATPRRASAPPRPRPRPRPMVSEAIAKGDVQALNYFVAQKYIDALQEIASAPNQKLILMPLEAVGVIGAIGGIAELFRDALRQKGATG